MGTCVRAASRHNGVAYGHEENCEQGKTSATEVCKGERRGGCATRLTRSGAVV